MLEERRGQRLREAASWVRLGGGRTGVPGDGVPGDSVPSQQGQGLKCRAPLSGL